MTQESAQVYSYGRGEQCDGRPICRISCATLWQTDIRSPAMASITALEILESGDRLTRDEFHRRYCARPDLKKAELVEGVVYVASPVRQDVHSRPHGRM